MLAIDCNHNATTLVLQQESEFLTANHAKYTNPERFQGDQGIRRRRSGNGGKLFSRISWFAVEFPSWNCS
jgi:hypothetical protein